ncbi:hypothetical protein [Cupriavidus metallidurans]|nr:hypothetical protein [Cupriavidus metallidurans]
MTVARSRHTSTLRTAERRQAIMTRIMTIRMPGIARNAMAIARPRPT